MVATLEFPAYRLPMTGSLRNDMSTLISPSSSGKGLWGPRLPDLGVRCSPLAAHKTDMVGPGAVRR